MKKQLYALILLGIILLSSCTNPVSPTETPSTPEATQTSIPQDVDPIWINTDITEKVFEGLSMGDYKNRVFVKLTKDGQFELNIIYSDFEGVSPPEGSTLTEPIDCQIRQVLFYKGTYKYENTQYICTLDADRLYRFDFKGADTEKYKTDFLEYAKEHDPNYYEKYKSLFESYLVEDEDDATLVLTVIPNNDSVAIIRADSLEEGFKVESVEYDLEGTVISETMYGKNNEVEYVDYYKQETVDERNYTKYTTRKDKNGNVIYTTENVRTPNSSITTKKDAAGNEISKREQVTNENGVNITTYYLKQNDGSLYESITFVDSFQSQYYSLEKTTKDGKVTQYHYHHN